MSDEAQLAARGPAPPASDFDSAELHVERFDDLHALRGEWKRLAEAAGNVFGTWEWASAWSSELGRRYRPLVYACRARDGAIVGILPLCAASRGAFKTVRFIGHGPADLLGPICARADHPAVARAFGAAINSIPERVDLLLVERLAAEEGWHALLGGTCLRIESSPVLRLDGMTWEELLASRSANFRQQVRRRERKLVREHGLSYRLADDPDSLEADLEHLFRLHEQRWAHRSAAFSPARRAFHRAFARSAQARGWLRLWIAEIGGQPVAAWYGFRFAGVEWYYQAGRDPAWEQASIGFVLMAHTIREAANDGTAEYRLLRGDEPYKARFANDERSLETLGLPGTRAGRAAVRGAVASRHLPGRAGRVSGWVIDRGP